MGRDIRIKSQDILPIATEMMDLNDTLYYHAVLYYNEDRQEIEDYEFDAMVKKLKELEEEHPGIILINSYSRQVGIPVDFEYHGTNICVMGKKEK